VTIGARIVDLIVNNNVKPHDILTLTFADANTRKLQQLVEMNLPITYSGVKIKPLLFVLNDMLGGNLNFIELYSHFISELNSSIKSELEIPEHTKVMSFNQQMNFVKSHLHDMPATTK
jgi:hypothetical protein